VAVFVGWASAGHQITELVIDPHHLALEATTLVAVAAAEPAAEVGEHPYDVVHEYRAPGVVRRAVGGALERRHLVDVSRNVVAVDEDVETVRRRRLPVGHLPRMEDRAEPGVTLKPVIGVESTNEAKRVGGRAVAVFNGDLAPGAHHFFYGTGGPVG